MNAYSLDLRERVLMAVDAGEVSQQMIATLFHVSARWIRKLLAQRAATGSIAPKSRAGGRPHLIRAEAIDTLREVVRQDPDATLEELRSAIGFEGCIMTVWRTLKRLKITRKKSRCTPKSNSIPRFRPSARSGRGGPPMSTLDDSSSSMRATPRRT
jgi:transposase